MSNGVKGVVVEKSTPLFRIIKHGSVYRMRRYLHSVDITWRHDDIDPQFGDMYTVNHDEQILLYHVDVIPKIHIHRIIELEVIGTDLNLLLGLPGAGAVVLNLHQYQVDAGIINLLQDEYSDVWLFKCGNKELTNELPITHLRINDGFCLDNLAPPRTDKLDQEFWIRSIIISPKLRAATMLGVSDIDIRDYLENLSDADLKAIMNAEISKEFS